jgi:hypothetical protein
MKVAKRGFTDGVTLETIGCVICGAASTKMCSRCKIVKYCCAEHQHEHWPDHKIMCGEADALRAAIAMPEKSTEISMEDCDIMSPAIYTYVETRLRVNCARLLTAKNVVGKDGPAILTALFCSSIACDHPAFGEARRLMAHLALTFCSQIDKRILNRIGAQHNRFLMTEERIYLMLFGYGMDFEPFISAYNAWVKK